MSSCNDYNLCPHPISSSPRINPASHHRSAFQKDALKHPPELVPPCHLPNEIGKCSRATLTTVSCLHPFTQSSFPKRHATPRHPTHHSELDNVPRQLLPSIAANVRPDRTYNLYRQWSFDCAGGSAVRQAPLVRWEPATDPSGLGGRGSGRASKRVVACRRGKGCCRVQIHEASKLCV